MGQSLVIRSADFSEVGFKLEYEEKVITDLYNAKKEVITDWEAQTTRALGIYFYERANDHTLAEAGNLENIASTQLIDVEDYQFARVYTMNNIGTTDDVLGIAIMMFVDANLRIVGGFSTASEGIDTITKGVGAVTTFTEFSMEIPSDAKYVVCTFTSIKSEDDFKDFKLTLLKLK